MEETFDEVIAEMNWAHDNNVSTDAVGIASYAYRLKSAHDREVATLKSEKKCDWNSNRCGGGCLVWDDNVKMSAEILMLKSTIENMKNVEKKEVR